MIAQPSDLDLQTLIIALYSARPSLQNKSEQQMKQEMLAEFDAFCLTQPVDPKAKTQWKTLWGRFCSKVVTWHAAQDRQSRGQRVTA